MPFPLYRDGSALTALIIAASVSAQCVDYLPLGLPDPGGLTGFTLGALAADLDGDGVPEFVAPSTAQTYIYRATTLDPPTYEAIPLPSASCGNLDAADLNGDGATDLVCILPQTGLVFWMEQSAAEPLVFTRRPIASHDSGARDVHAADVNADGAVDVFTFAGASSQLHLYLNDGGSPPQFTATPMPGQDFGTSVDTADLDGDGDLDVISVAGEDALVWYENDGAATPAFTRRQIPTLAGLSDAAVGDLDGDGDIDLAICTATGPVSSVAWIENRGGQPLDFFTRAFSNAHANARFVDIADADSDGRPDVFASSTQDDQIAWYRNELVGGGPRFVRRIITIGQGQGSPGALPGPAALALADADLDGDADLFALSPERIALLFENGPPPPGAFGPTTPADGATGVALSSPLRWESAGCGVVYEVRLAPDTSPDEPIYESTTDAPLANLPLGLLEQARDYVWTVRATNERGTQTISPDPASFSTSLPIDLDGDGFIDVGDLNILLTAFGLAGEGLTADLNGDARVDFSDLNILITAIRNAQAP